MKKKSPAPTRDDVAVNLIRIPADRLRKPDEATITELAKSIEAHGLLQRIGVREFAKPDRAGKEFAILWGASRHAAYRRNLDRAIAAGDKAAERRWETIPAAVYAPDTSDDQARLLEITENLIRCELAADERAAQRVEYIALLKAEGKTVSANEARRRAAKRGGGNAESKSGDEGERHDVADPKMAKQQAAADLSLTPKTFERDAKRVGEQAGEAVDLERDSAEALQRKAQKAREAAATAKSKPKKPAKEPAKTAAKAEAASADGEVLPPRRSTVSNFRDLWNDQHVSEAERAQIRRIARVRTAELDAARAESASARECVTALNEKLTAAIASRDAALAELESAEAKLAKAARKPKPAQTAAKKTTTAKKPAEKRPAAGESRTAAP